MLYLLGSNAVGHQRAVYRTTLSYGRNFQVYHRPQCLPRRRRCYANGQYHKTRGRRCSLDTAASCPTSSLLFQSRTTTAIKVLPQINPLELWPAGDVARRCRRRRKLGLSYAEIYDRQRKHPLQLSTVHSYPVCWFDDTQLSRLAVYKPFLFVSSHSFYGTMCGLVVYW